MFVAYALSDNDAGSHTHKETFEASYVIGCGAFVYASANLQLIPYMK